MNHTKRKIIATLLLITLGIYILPKELIHELHSHEETVHINCTEHQGPHLEALHTHCETLQLFTQPFFGHFLPHISIYKFYTKNLISFHTIFFPSINSFHIPSQQQQIKIQILKTPLKFVPGCFADKNGWTKKSNFEEVV